MTHFELRTLGGLSLLADGRPVGAASRKPLAVLAIAAVAGPDGVSRHRLISLLWPDLPRSRANHVLSQTLYALRRDLGGEILVTGETVALDLSQLSWDVDRFRKELREGDLESAVRGYRGPFLDGVSFPDCDELDAWIAPLRSTLAAEYASAMGRLSERAASANRLTEAPTRLNQQRAGSKLVGRTAALVVAFAGVIVTAALSWQSITASRQDENAGLFDELDRERLRLFRERERSSRGRIFIETAINRSGHPFLDSIGRQLTSVLANVVDNSRIAHVVPRDSVKMIESDVAKLGWATPDKRLERAAAFINVMTVVSGSPDTPRVHVAVQRITNGSSRASRDFSNEMRRYEKLPPLPVPGSRPFKGMETVPFKTVVAPRDSMRRMVSEIARELSRAFDDMRFCDINHHDKPQSLPWCWADENKPVVVKGYYKARQERLRLAKGMTP